MEATYYVVRTASASYYLALEVQLTLVGEFFDRPATCLTKKYFSCKYIGGFKMVLGVPLGQLGEGQICILP